MDHTTQQEAEARLRASEASLAAAQEREREFARLSRLYEALSRINHAIVRTPTRAELFREICRALVEQGGFGLSWIGWHAPELGRIVPLASFGDENGYVSTIQVGRCPRRRDPPHGVPRTATLHLQ